MLQHAIYSIKTKKGEFWAGFTNTLMVAWSLV
jgi:hypothetical protein